MRRRGRDRGRVDQKILDNYLTRETRLLTAVEVKALIGTMRITVEQLIDLLLPWVAEKAVVPVSKYKVGAVCRGNSGSLYFGINIEFNGQPLNSTIHAEQSSIANAVAHGENGIKAIAVTASPCGQCRQFLNEINSADQLTIHVLGQEPVLLPDLLPKNFGPRDLNIEHCLFDSNPINVSLENQSDDELVKQAVLATQSSYSPYTDNPAGVAIKTINGQIFTGSYIENAAYNPSLLPLQACLSNLIIAGRTLPEIEEGVLVCKKSSTVNHAIQSAELFKGICSFPLKVYNML